MATWQERCPLRGICTECGLEFEWSHVLQPEKFEPPWCVEYARSRNWPVATVRTFLRSWMPWRFWSRLQMAHRVRWLPLTAYILVLSAMTVLSLYLVVQISSALYVRNFYQSSLRVSITSISQSPRPTQLEDWQIEVDGMSLDHYRLMHGEPDEAQLQQAMDGLLLARQIEWDQQQAWLATNPRISHSALYCALEAVLFPTRSISPVTVPHPSRQLQYPAPRYLNYAVRSVWLNQGQFTRLQFMQHLQDTCLLGYCIGALLFLLLPATFVLLPISRRRAKVRWRHVARIAGYGMFIPISGLFINTVVLILAIGIGSQLPTRFALLTSWWFIPIATVTWWTFAIGRYLKMPHALAVAVLMAVLCAFVLLGAAYFIAPVAVVAWLLTW